MVNVKFFAMLKGIAGVEAKEYDIAVPVTVQALKRMVGADIPALAEALSSRSVLVSVNHEVAGEGALVSNGDEVAFLPPYSGG